MNATRQPHDASLLLKLNYLRDTISQLSEADQKKLRDGYYAATAGLSAMLEALSNANAIELGKIEDNPISQEFLITANCRQLLNASRLGQVL